jgi:hypothetical protein
MKWNEVTEERYMEMLEILPPAVWVAKGFLVGEPVNHRKCWVCGACAATFSPFLRYQGKFYEGDEPMTALEFRAINPEMELH